MALVPVKPKIFKIRDKKAGKAAGEAKPKPKGRSKKSKAQTSSENPVTLSTATGGGGKGGLPSAPSSGMPSAKGADLPVPKSASGVAKMRAGRSGRKEKFMGNAERVQNAQLPGVGAKGKKSGAGKAVIAGGAAAGAAALYGLQDDSPVPTATVPKKNQPSASTTGQKITISKPPTGGASGAMGGATPIKAKDVPKKREVTPTDKRKGAANKQSMADYLGLSKDSAVRTYMETGKHKYEPKRPKK